MAERIAKGLALVIIAWIAAAVVLLVSMAGDAVHPGGHRNDPFAPTEGNRPARQGPTGFPLPPVHLDENKLIIQQNPTCWSGMPGWTCTKEAS